jgi:HEAT repeat protein
MTALGWKLGTFAGAAASVFFALHPMRGGTEKPTQANHATSEAAQAARPSWSFAGLFGGKTQTAASAASTDLAAKLRAASTPEEACAALGELGAAGDETATQAILGALDASRRSQVRVCATDALGHIATGEARSWLEELARDRDNDVSATAIRALATSDDPSARDVVLGIARDGTLQQRTVAVIALATAKVKSATPLIVALLPSVDVSTQRDLIAALGASGDAAAIPAVSEAARNGSLTVRQTAVSALGAIGGDTAVAALSALLQSGRRDLLAQATTALAQANTPAARRALFDALDGPRRDIASAALEALSNLDGPEVRDAMLHALDGSDRASTALAGQWFGAHHDETVVPKLAELARHGGPEVGQNAMAALASIGGDGARDAILDLASNPGPSQSVAIAQLTAVTGDPGVARALCIKLSRDAGGNAAMAAVNVLGEDTSPEAGRALVDAVRSGSAAAPQALAWLAKRGDEASLGAVADVARTGAGDTRLQALEALGGSGDPRATTTLLASLKESDPNVRRVALGALASVGGSEAERAIATVATTGSPEDRLTATQSLAQLGADAAGPLEKLAHDADPDVARTALLGLAADAPDRAARVIGDVAHATDPQTRLVAIQATQQLEPDDASRILVAALRDGDVSVTQTAAAGLGRLGTPEGEAALADLMTLPTAPYEAQRAAADALAEAGGEVATRYASVIARLRAMPTPVVTEGSEGEM